MKKKIISGIGRPIDPNYATNRVIALITFLIIVCGFVFKVLTGKGFIDGILWGIQAGIAVFLTWAIDRELDTDYNTPAFIAVGLSLVAMVVWGLSVLGILFWLVLAVRIINRITGVPATIADSSAFIVLGMWLSYQTNWGIGILTALVFLLDAWLPSGKKIQFLFLGLSLIVLAGIYLLWGYAGYTQCLGEDPIVYGILALLLSLFFIPVIVRTRFVTCMCDDPEEVPLPLRIQAGQVFALLAGLEMVLWHGRAGLIDLLPLWACFFSSSIHAGYQWIRRRPNGG